MVGGGLLTAAVCGDIFASPTANAVYNAICTVAGKAGCLVVVMNYMGDRLHFGMAVERAKQNGLNVNMVIVADDCGLELSEGKSRGIAGSVVVVKMACASAANGSNLETVSRVAADVANSIKTMGVALSDCTLPTAEPKHRIPKGHMELGLGIHGEPGKMIIPSESSSILTMRLIKHISLKCAFNDIQKNCVLLINNLGSMTPIELTQVVSDSLHAARSCGLTVVRHGGGTYISSLDMHGFSISILPVGDDEVDLIDRQTSAPGWTSFKKTGNFWEATPIAVPKKRDIAELPVTEGANAEVAKQVLTACCNSIISQEAVLTKLDEMVGDGDCGITLKNGSQQILNDISKYPLTDSYRTALSLSSSIEASMGGTSGGLYAIAFEAAATSLKNSPLDYIAAFNSGVEALGKYGGMYSAYVCFGFYCCCTLLGLVYNNNTGAGIGSCTMMDALIPASEELTSGSSLSIAAAAAKSGAESTASLIATHGRSSYVPDEKVKGVVDPGALACATWMSAAAECFAK